MNELQVKDITKFMGIEIPNIYGGFGEDKKCVLAKTVAEIHETKLFKINELINEHLDEFEFGIDILDLKDNKNFLILCRDNGILTQNAINRSEHIYLLSEQGYMLLIGFMKSDKAKELRKQFRREYFQMKEIINSNEQLKEKLVYKIYKGGQDGILASRQLVDLEVQEATAPLLAEIEELSPLAKKYNIFLDTEGLTDIDTFAKNLGIKGLGRNNMYKYLRDNEYLRKDNKPYQKYIDSKLFIIKPSGYHTVNGEVIQDYKTFLTTKGINKIINKLVSDKYIDIK